MHLAGMLSDVGQTDEFDVEAFVSLVQPFAWQIVGLTPEQCAVIKNEVESQLDDVMFLIFPGSKTVHSGSRLAIGI